MITTRLFEYVYFEKMSMASGSLQSIFAYDMHGIHNAYLILPKLWEAL